MTELHRPPPAATPPAAAPAAPAAAPAAPERPAGPRTVLPGAPRAATMPAGKVLLVMVVALVLAALFNSDRFVRAAETMPFGWQRTALLAVARPVDDVATALRFDRPRRAIDSALGRDVTEDDGTGAFGPPPSGAASPAASASASAAPSASASAAPPGPVFRDVSAAAPLRLFVTGDSMIEFMAPKLIAQGGAAVEGASEVKYGTGLVRDDVFDWPAHARTQLAKHDPEAVIMLMGGNDGQNFAMPGGAILQAGSAEWTAEYRRRATVMMRLLTEGGRHVYWVGMPPAKSERLTRAYRGLNDALAAAARDVPGVTYVDIWTDFAPDGRYTNFLDVGGRSVLVRARDGIHVNGEGAGMIARKLHALIDRDWKLTS